jgi:hypothetical protein
MALETVIARQLFQTQIGVHASSLTAQFVTVPVRSLDKPGLLLQPKDLLKELQLELLKPLPLEAGHQPAPFAAGIGPADSAEVHRSVQFALVSILDEPSALEAVHLMERLMQATPAEQRWLASDQALAFAEQMTSTPMVPFESSALGLESLLGIIAKGSGPTIGAAVAVVAFGPTPLLLIAAPAGMIIGGAALGVGQALQQGLRNRLLSLMGVRPSDVSEAA